jgi:hypothetical protein
MMINPAEIARRAWAILKSKWRADGHCHECGIVRGTKWKGARIKLYTLQANGKRSDFRQDNLIQLCQHCYALASAGISLAHHIKIAIRRIRSASHAN